VVSWGELLWDLYPDGPRLGGAAGNVAYHVARLGVTAALVSRVGDDELGHRALGSLRAAGVDASAVQVDPERPTGTVRVELEQGEPRFRIVEEAAWDRIEWTEPVERAVRQARVLCFGTLAQRTLLGGAVLRRALASSAADCVRLCDLNVRRPFDSAEVIEQSLALADAVKLNEAEAAHLARVFGVNDVPRWLVEERGVAVVALTRGARGSELVTRDERASHAGYPLIETNGDAVGAGDAFTAVLACAVLRGSNLEATADAANRYASYVASQRGAMPPVPDEAVPW
jgi:fructokinase